MDVVALGELLIDFTENGVSGQGNPLFEANPGGAPCNVLAMLSRLGHRTAFIGKVIDTRTELMVQEAFDRLMEGRTSFIVAHRLSTIRNADEILVMKDGSIVEQGSHDELMAKGGFYQNLYNSQFVKVAE